MADFTGAAIRSSFLKLLNEKPLKQISVRDIVDDCGINRNTFYYHYQGIPDLVECIIREDADRIIQSAASCHSIEECLDAVISFSLENRRAVMHIYKSVNRDLFEQHQWRICDYTVSSFLNEALKDRKISDFDRAAITSYIRSLCFGVVLGWLQGGMQDDIQSFVHRMCQLKQGELERLLESCEISVTSR